jgi:type IV pilus assembly protein PilP
MYGCAPEGDDIEAWMQAQRTQVRVPVQAPPAMHGFEPQPYGSADRMDPFHPGRLQPTTSPASASRRVEPALARELARTPQALEAYALEQIAMVGSLIQEGKAEALVRADGRVHVVRAGDRIGRDRGRVVRIGERHIELREWVLDDAGAWVERDNRLELRETAR